jgi:metal-responsive CopG/Arc/MetJ family transcriptional regulator
MEKKQVGRPKKQGPKRIVVSHRLPKEVFEGIDRWANNNRMSRNAAIEQAVRALLRGEWENAAV